MTNGNELRAEIKRASMLSAEQRVIQNLKEKGLIKDELPPQDSPDELEREAQSLIEKFRFGSIGENNYDYAKQCAIIHCDLMLEYLTPFDQNRTHYTNLKEKINSL